MPSRRSSSNIVVEIFQPTAMVWHANLTAQSISKKMGKISGNVGGVILLLFYLLWWPSFYSKVDTVNTRMPHFSTPKQLIPKKNRRILGPPSFPGPCKKESSFPLTLFPWASPEVRSWNLNYSPFQRSQDFSPHCLLFVSVVACSYHRPYGPTALEIRQIYLPLRTKSTSVNMLIEAWNCFIYWCSKVLSSNVPPLSPSTCSGPSWLKVFRQ